MNVNQVVLTWNNSSDNVGIPTYEVYRDGVLIGSRSTNTYTDPTVAANTGVLVPGAGTRRGAELLGAEHRARRDDARRG